MKDGKYLTAGEKTKILKSFERFVKSGFKETLFTKAVYKHLSLHFGFIAHYNQQGFYSARFEDAQGLAKTLHAIVNASPWTFVDDNTSGNADLNRGIQNVVKQKHSELAAVAVERRRAELKNIIESAAQQLVDLGSPQVRITY